MAENKSLKGRLEQSDFKFCDNSKEILLNYAELINNLQTPFKEKISERKELTIQHRIKIDVEEKEELIKKISKFNSENPKKYYEDNIIKKYINNFNPTKKLIFSLTNPLENINIEKKHFTKDKILKILKLFLAGTKPKEFLSNDEYKEEIYQIPISKKVQTRNDEFDLKILEKELSLHNVRITIINQLFESFSKVIDNQPIHDMSIKTLNEIVKDYNHEKNEEYLNKREILKSKIQNKKEINLDNVNPVGVKKYREELFSDSDIEDDEEEIVDNDNEYDVEENVNTHYEDNDEEDVDIDYEDENDEDDNHTELLNKLTYGINFSDNQNNYILNLIRFLSPQSDNIEILDKSHLEQLKNVVQDNISSIKKNNYDLERIKTLNLKIEFYNELLSKNESVEYFIEFVGFIGNTISLNKFNYYSINDDSTFYFPIPNKIQ